MWDDPGLISPREVGRRLGQIVYEIAQLVTELGEADLEAVRAKVAHERAYAIAFRQSSGSIEARRHIATEMCHGRRLAAEEAAARVRDINNKIKFARDRIDVGRSYGAALRAEASATGSPWTEG
jgi:hypothetical protein